MDKFEHTPEERMAILAKIKTDPSYLRECSESLLANKEFMIEAIKANPDAIEYAPTSFLNDKDVLFESLKNDPSTIRFATPEMQAIYAEEGITAFNPSPINVVERNVKNILDMLRHDPEEENKYKKSPFYIPGPFDPPKPTPDN